MLFIYVQTVYLLKSVSILQMSAQVNRVKADTSAVSVEIPFYNFQIQVQCQQFTVLVLLLKRVPRVLYFGLDSCFLSLAIYPIQSPILVNRVVLSCISKFFTPSQTYLSSSAYTFGLSPSSIQRYGYNILPIHFSSVSSSQRKPLLASTANLCRHQSIYCFHTAASPSLKPTYFSYFSYQLCVAAASSTYSKNIYPSIRPYYHNIQRLGIGLGLEWLLLSFCWRVKLAEE